MADDNSVRTPTRSELNTFKVLANLDFTNFARPDPQSRNTLDAAPVREEDDRRTESTQSSRRSRSASRDSLEGPPSVRHDEPVRPPPGGTNGPNGSNGPTTFVPRDSASVASSRRSRPESRPSTPRKPEAFPETVHVEDVDADILAATQEDVSLEKEALLYELDIMEKQGTLTLHRKLTMNDSLEAIQYQYDRANMIASTQQSVEWAKTALKMGSTVLEAVLKRFGVSVVDGFSNNLCKDMNRFNKPLTKMYRKYWRRGTSSPEMELAMIVVGALVMTVVGNKGLLGSFLGGGSSKSTEATPVAKPAEVSTMKPPSVGNLVPPQFANFGPPAVPAAPAAPPRPPAAIPEWAKAALAGPLGPEKPAHFATAPAWPEERRPPPPPMIPVSLAAMNNIRVPVRPITAPAPAPVAPAPAPAPAPVTETAEQTDDPLAMALPPPRAGIPESASITRAREENVRRLTLASPKSSRKKREPVAELNLDE
jgi:hypothetical protein